MFDNSKLKEIQKYIEVVDKQNAFLGSCVTQLNAHIVTIADSLQAIRNDITELRQRLETLENKKCSCKEENKTPIKLQLNENNTIDEYDMLPVQEKKSGKFDKTITSA